MSFILQKKHMNFLGKPIETYNQLTSNPKNKFKTKNSPNIREIQYLKACKNVSYCFLCKERNNSSQQKVLFLVEFVLSSLLSVLMTYVLLQTTVLTVLRRKQEGREVER